MKQFNKLSLSALSLVLVPIAFAVDTHNGDISGDLYFPNGVLLEDTTSSTAGTASVELGGDGSLTIGNQAGPGGFPRLTVVGGTTITSKRAFSQEETNITTWSGQFSAPGTTIKPSSGDITFVGGHQVDEVEVMDAFNWGLSNETFTFGPAARVMLPIDALDNQKLWIAYEGTDGTWTAQDDEFCVILNGLCYTEVGNVNKLAVVKKQYDVCPRSSVSDGTVGSAPNCVITCDNGYELGESGDACVEAGSDGLGFEENTNVSDEVSDTGFSEETAFIVPEKEYEFPPGHFRYRSSVGNMYRYLDESGLEDEELEIARHVNTTYLSRNPRSAEEQLEAREMATAKDTAQSDESFVNYLIQMRNRFGDNAQENHFVALSDEGGSEESDDNENTGEVASGDSEEQSASFHSAGGMLPSTGPGMFLTIAIIGIGLMMFGFRRS